MWTTELYEYIVEVEISAVDVGVLEHLKDILNNASLPIRVSDSVNITEVNITIGKRSTCVRVTAVLVCLCPFCYNSSVSLLRVHSQVLILNITF